MSRKLTDKITISPIDKDKFQVTRVLDAVKTRKDLELDLKNLEIENEKLSDMLEDNNRKIEELKLALASKK